MPPAQNLRDLQAHIDKVCRMKGHRLSAWVKWPGSRGGDYRAKCNDCQFRVLIAHFPGSRRWGHVYIRDEETYSDPPSCTTFAALAKRLAPET